jgi:membrane protein YqaA with SNARE-associated domain
MPMVDMTRPPPEEEAVTLSGEQPERGKKNWLKTYWKLSFVPLSLLISLVIIANRDRLQQVPVYGYPGVFLISLLGSATIIFPAPSLAVVFAMGGVLNPLLVGIVAGAGEALGELTGFMAGYGGQVVVERYGVYHRFRGYMEKYGLITIFVLSVIPSPFFDLAGLAAGAMRYPVWQFLLVCWAGKTIKTVAVAYLGASSVHMLDRWLF